MGVSAERRRELRLAKAPAFPRPKGRAPDGCTWNKQAGGWFKDDGSVGVSRSEKRKLAAAIKEEAAASEKENREEKRAAAEKLERSFTEGVRFDGETVYCQHLRPLNGLCVIEDRDAWEAKTYMHPRNCKIVHANVVDTSKAECSCQRLDTARFLDLDDPERGRRPGEDDMNCIRYVFRPVRALSTSHSLQCA